MHEPSERAVSRNGSFRSSNLGQNVKNPHHSEEPTCRPWVLLLCWFGCKNNSVSINHGRHGIHGMRTQILLGLISVCSECSVVPWCLTWNTRGQSPRQPRRNRLRNRRNNPPPTNSAPIPSVEGSGTGLGSAAVAPNEIANEG
jgi:hypothetical protein